LFVGDLFEREEDITNPKLWQHVAGSDDQHKQQQNRNMILNIADWILPGHGPISSVLNEKKHNPFFC
jgi:glyoxylase-like metal-dependent hydrolase (beta-lactamase superfamily II)